MTATRAAASLPGPVIDVHAHAAVPAAFGIAAGQPGFAEARAVEDETFGARARELNEEQLVRVLPLLSDLATRFAAMDRMGVDIQLLSPSPVHYHDWAAAPLSEKITRTVNEGMAQQCLDGGGRLVGLGTVPLHHPDVATAELTRAVTELGLRGVEISTSAAGRELADPDFEPFWARAEELGALVFIHPWGCSLGARLNQHYLANVVGQPVETTLALSHIIFSGLLDRRPELRILAAHGGGYLPQYIGRSDHAWQVRDDCRTPQAAPSEYLRRLYFDSLVYEPRALQTLIAAAGAGHVLLGTDFPFDMGVDDPLTRLDAVTSLTPEQGAAIAGATAAGLLGVEQRAGV
jgi:aminocarboxymuconate-semialdehyde decarboxylase